MSSAGSSSLTTAVSKIYSDAGGCTEFTVEVLSGSTSNALVHIDSVHDGDSLTGDYATIIKGNKQSFRLPHLGIRAVYAKGDGGAASIIYSVTEKSTNS